MAEHGDIDKRTIAQAQAAIERDFVFLNLTDAEIQSLYQELTTESHQFPAFDELELAIPPEVRDAAQFLVNLLLGE